ncbi:beta-hexosaminidase subunit beta-like isoform X2 [Mercenaria mercenaria]|uniref:beta-hexosaminidase subunit beta-like isoform X2 n=1 Tax=Mercenaria mercenaria TaxID=6596 RepID=UPI00234F1396|nr:beta-hexosaminidase subunit beta-like isoform X2 [Mercenaria mercenaria]
MASALGLLFISCITLSVVYGNSQIDDVKKYPDPSPQTRGSPWPAPKQMTISETQLTVDQATFKFEFSETEVCSILEEAFVRYFKIIFGSYSTSLKFSSWKTLRSNIGSRSRYSGTVSALQVVSPCIDNIYPSLTSDESYTLEISEKGVATLKASEVWGALRGLETFSQLIYQDGLGTFVLNATSIEDAPRFQHRGLLLDTSRHFLSLDVLKENLDVMSQNKLNVFHWHIVDDQAFPYESSTFPDMSMKGAYNAFTHVYTQENVKEIIEYARLRGIRVIPEFDSPGHTMSWGKAIANLLTKCYSGGKPSGDVGPVNPAFNTTYTFLQNFFQEISTVFPDHYVHLGGDEVSFDCWKSNPDITAFMENMGYGKDYAKLEEYYMEKLLNIVSGLKKAYIIWQEVIDNGAKVAIDTVVEVWKPGYVEEMSRVTSLGYKTLLAAPWYLDYISIQDWPRYYMADPQNFNGTKAQKDLVMGGEACIWGEFVDGTNLLSRLWPRASAVAERLWSPASFNDTKLATPRIDEHRCRLVRRGYPAEPLNGPSFCGHEYVYHQ